MGRFSTFIALAMAGLTAAAPRSRAEAGSHRILLDVAATAPWTDTGLTVAPGDRIDIRAWGIVRFARVTSERSAAPQGMPRIRASCGFVVLNPVVPAYSLVANVAPALTFDGKGFFVGTRWSGTVPISGTSSTAGRLYLGFNDDAVMCDRGGYDSWGFRNDNSGAFTVQVIVSRER